MVDQQSVSAPQQVRSGQTKDGNVDQPIDAWKDDIATGSSASVDSQDLALAEASELSLADIERSRSHPLQWVAYAVAVLVAIIAPYWFGRMLAVQHTEWVVAHISIFQPQGIAFIAWTVTVVAFTGLAMMIVESKSWLWRVVFIIGLALEQLIAGVSLLKLSFWYSTYVVYGDSSNLVNAANLGIISAGFAVAVYAVVFVGLLVLIRKDSPLNVLTRSWASFILFFVIETSALLIVLFGGLLSI
ncbi:hypothetical protein [Bifidobacterium tsurumiense]|nr:hypothetical protein [Bifidobacterium tsurumiense]MDY4677904.1 hypothetical protein [Bifidobacterium tsurumiense]